MIHVVLMIESRKHSTYVNISKIISQTCLIIDLVQWSPNCSGKNHREADS